MGSLKRNIGIDGHVDQKRLNNIKRILKEKSEIKTILEVGCDDGTFANGFAELNYEVFAIDIDCSKAREIHNHDNITYIDCHAEELSKHITDKVDCVHLGELLEHVKDPRQVMREVGRCTREHALYIVSVPDFRHPEHIRRYSMKTAIGICRKFFDIEGKVVLMHDHKLPSTKRFQLWGHKR